MDRIACAYIPRFELAVRARTAPDCWTRVAAIADLAAARARLLCLTPAAEKQGLRLGMSLSEAFALCPQLEVLAPDPETVLSARNEIRAVLGKLSPAIDEDGNGAFFVTASSLEHVHPDELVLAQRIKSGLHQLGYEIRVGLADGSLAAWIAARRTQSVTRVPPGKDSSALAEVAVAELGLSPPLLERLELLGIRCAGQLATLPRGALADRLSDGARLERFCRGEVDIAWPVSSRIPASPDEVALDLDSPTDDLEVLLFLLKGLLDRLLPQVALTRRALAELLIVTRLDDRSQVEHRLRPAGPTLDNRLLLDLLRLWLSSGPFRSQVSAFRLVAAQTAVASHRQLGLFQQQQEIADDALQRAVARLSAAFGAHAAVRPILADTFRPEARVGWIPFTAPARKENRSDPRGRLDDSAATVLHLLPQPEGIQWSGHQIRRAHGTTIRVVHLDGPHHFRGEWWAEPFARKYFWLLGSHGERLWLFRSEPDLQEGCSRLQAIAD